MRSKIPRWRVVLGEREARASTTLVIRGASRRSAPVCFAKTRGVAAQIAALRSRARLRLALAGRERERLKDEGERQGGPAAISHATAEDVRQAPPLPDGREGRGQSLGRVR